MLVSHLPRPRDEVIPSISFHQQELVIWPYVHARMAGSVVPAGRPLPAATLFWKRVHEVLVNLEATLSHRTLSFLG